MVFAPPEVTTVVVKSGATVAPTSGRQLSLAKVTFLVAVFNVALLYYESTAFG
jgi:hypothetical protein